MNLTEREQEHVRKLATANGGRITAEDILKDARKKTSPLHDRFEWDQKKAAHAHWLETARRIIRSVKIEISTETTEVKAVAYVRDPEARRHNRAGYIETKTAGEHEWTAEQVMEDELRRIEGALRRIKGIAHLLDREVDVNRLVALIGDIRKQRAA